MIINISIILFIFWVPYDVSDAQVTENFVRLAEDRQSQSGSLWNVVVRVLSSDIFWLEKYKD